MRDDYLDQVLRRAGELSALEEAALRLPDRPNTFRWAVAAAVGLFVALFPAACTAQSFLHHIII